MTSPSNGPHPKVYAAGVGAGIGGSLTIVLLYIAATYWNFNPPPQVSEAIAVIITSIISLAAAYITPSDAKGT
jgi:hypothetical protein